SMEQPGPGPPPIFCRRRRAGRAQWRKRMISQGALVPPPDKDGPRPRGAARMPQPHAPSAGQAPAPRGGAVTLKDVAALARVSTATVSHVINNTRRVKPETQGRVLAAIGQL